MDENIIEEHAEHVTDENKEIRIKGSSNTHTEYKSWKSYLWEFLMLFLAVFLGFYANYQLDTKIEKDKARELAKSFYVELKNDSITAEVKVQNRIKQEKALRYLISYFQDSSFNNLSKPFAINFTYGIVFRSPALFEPRTIVLDQLRNAGSLRFFKNDEFQSLTGDLYVAIKNVMNRQELEDHSRRDYITPLQVQYYDFDFDAVLKKGDKTIFEGMADYETNNEFIPFLLEVPDKVERNKIVRSLYNYMSNNLTSTRKTHIKKYQEINARLLKILRDKYNIN